MLQVYLSPLTNITKLIPCCRPIRKHHFFRGQKMFKKASKLYHKELYIIELVRKVRDAESFRRLFLNRQ